MQLFFVAKMQMKHFSMIYNHCESLQASFELGNIPKLRMVRWSWVRLFFSHLYQQHLTFLSFRP